LDCGIQIVQRDTAPDCLRRFVVVFVVLLVVFVVLLVVFVVLLVVFVVLLVVVLLVVLDFFILPHRFHRRCVHLDALLLSTVSSGT
jgi:uncharacterized protein (DUF983 family)